MTFTLLIFLVAGGLFLGLLAFLDVGRRIGLARRARDAGAAQESMGAVEGAVYGLLGLLIAFTFSGAASRFEGRRQLIVQEANAIGTAYLRLDLVPAEARSVLQDKFRRYLDARLEAYRRLPDIEAAKAGLARAVAFQGEIWSDAVAACQAAGGPAAVLLLPAINEMIDITTTRMAATQQHPPLVVFGMLVAMALISALLVGYATAGGKSRSGLHLLAYAFVLAASVYVILDLEYPRLGLIRVDEADQLLVEVRQGMN